MTCCMKGFIMARPGIPTGLFTMAMSSFAAWIRDSFSRMSASHSSVGIKRWRPERRPHQDQGHALHPRAWRCRRQLLQGFPCRILRHSFLQSGRSFGSHCRRLPVYRNPALPCGSPVTACLGTFDHHKVCSALVLSFPVFQDNLCRFVR